ncbi:hypothetical protein HZA55_01870 [Candidatus Poribacteria bacterium]|nr:hypothetical protein [Candidatus Poribacteria bacterium]
MNKNINKEKTQKIIERLDGTLIADLRSLKVVAEKRQNHERLKKYLPGGLNFALFLFGLIACETLGFFIKKDSNEGSTEENIKGFIQSEYFKKDSAFRKDKYLNILVSLRHNLAHVFGMTDLNDWDLCVGGINKPEMIQINKNVKLNGIKFVELVINGFELIKSEVQKNGKSDLVKIIASKESV